MNNRDLLSQEEWQGLEDAGLSWERRNSARVTREHSVLQQNRDTPILPTKVTDEFHSRRLVGRKEND
jgi:hypothetical protein